MDRTESEIQKEKAGKKNRRAIHCAFWMNSRCYNKRRAQVASEIQSREVIGVYCFKDTKAKYCRDFQERDKKTTEAATQRTIL